MPHILAECGALKKRGAEGPPRERRASRKNGKHFLRDYTRFAPPHGNCPMRADVAGSWGTSYPGRSKIRCIVILLLFRSSGWAS